MVKMICVDIDGTILNKGKIHPTTLLALQHARSLNIPVVIATGRNVSSIRKSAEALNLYGCGYHFVSQNGAQIFKYLKDGSIAIESTIAFSKSQAKELFSLAKKHHIAIYGYSVDETVNYTTNRLNPISVFLKFRAKHPKLLTIKNIEQGPDLTKCLCFGNHKTMEAFKASITQHNYSIFPFSYASDAKSNIEINQAGVDKAHGIAFVCEQLKIDPHEIIYFGDGFNDVQAIKFAGHGVAMANAKQEIKQIANDVTDLPVELGGVGDYLFKNIFNK